VGDFVTSLPWPQFKEWFRDVWKPGEHVALIGPTGMGKTTFAKGILESRKYVLAFDPKGGDKTLKATGYQRQTYWPLTNKDKDEIAEGNAFQRIVGAVVNTDADFEKMKRLFDRVLKDAFNMGGWTLYIDEFQVATDRRIMGLASRTEKLLVAARDKGISVVTAYQAPAWVPTSASRQATWVGVWYTRDEDVIKKVANIMGQNKKELMAAMKNLPAYHVLLVGRNPRDPLVMTVAPKVS
jgi:energy-coupling factor transporter ATP-binding protein EcfA2